MEKIATALVRALASLAHPRMLWLMIWPLAAALALWIAIAAAWWHPVAGWIEVHLQPWPVYRWAIELWPLRLVAAWLGTILIALLLAPLVLLTAVIIIGVVAMPTIVAHVGARDYAELARRRGGSFLGSLWNALVAVAGLAVLALLSLPFWLVPLLWPVLPVLLLGWFNQRVFRYDALAEHASREEAAEIVRRHGGGLYALGALLALLGHVPLLGLVMPVYAGLAVVHYVLDRLRELRAEPVRGEAARE